MKMKTILLLFLAASVGMASPIPDFPFLFVGGDASEDVPTARAQITFRIANENEKSDVGEAALEEANLAVRALLKANGVKDKEIQVSDARKQRVSKDPFVQEKKQVYFEFSQDFEVTITDLSLYPKLAELFIGSDKVSGFNSSFYAGDLKEVTKRLRVAAIRNARENAETLSAASGAVLGTVHSISELDYSELGELIGQETYDPPNLPPGRDEVYKVPPTVKESFHVRVLYRLATPNTTKAVPATPSDGDKPSN